MINQPTRIFYYEDSHSVSCSTIDHLITNSSPCLSKVGILVTDVSDHLPIFGLLSLKKPCINPLKNTFRRCIMDKKKDEFLSWNASQAKGIEDLRLDIEDIWVPDIEVYNLISRKGLRDKEQVGVRLEETIFSKFGTWELKDAPVTSPNILKF